MWLVEDTWECGLVAGLEGTLVQCRSPDLADKSLVLAVVVRCRSLGLVVAGKPTVLVVVGAREDYDGDDGDVVVVAVVVDNLDLDIFKLFK
jgi:hypothetical protein